MSITGLRVRKSDWGAIVLHLEACLPEEGCGLLAGRGRQVEQVIPIENADHSRVRYRMDARGLVAALLRIESRGLEMLAAFHSHPQGPLGVSDTDLREWLYPEAALVVCAPVEGGWGRRAYLVGEDRLREVDVQIVED